MEFNPTEQLNSVPQPTMESGMTTFQPSQSGQINRSMYKSDVRGNESDALNQTLGMKDVSKSDIVNPVGYIYSRTMEFPQPSIIGIGAVTSGGAKDNSQYFFGQNWTVTRNSVGNYTITHNIGERKYLPILTSVSSTSDSIKLNTLTNNTFNVLGFTVGGAAVDCAFTFVVFLIP